MTYVLELTSENTFQTKRLARLYDDVDKACDICAKVSSDPYWKENKRVIAMDGFSVAVAGGHLTVREV